MPNKIINTPDLLKGLTFGASGGTASTNNSSYPSDYIYQSPPTVAGAWKVTKAGIEIATAEGLTKHHTYDQEEADPKQVSGFWSKRSGAYVYDMVLKRVEDGELTRSPFVPSPVNGTITFLGFYSNGKDSAIHIKSDDDGKEYKLLHTDVNNALVKRKDKVKAGQLLSRQADFMFTGVKTSGKQFAANIHLHVQFPSKKVLQDYIINLVNDSFPV
jgi:hypothetical protein